MPTEQLCYIGVTGVTVEFWHYMREVGGRRGDKICQT